MTARSGLSFSKILKSKFRLLANQIAQISDLSQNLDLPVSIFSRTPAQSKHMETRQKHPNVKMNIPCYVNLHKFSMFRWNISFYMIFILVTAYPSINAQFGLYRCFCSAPDLT